MQTVSASRTAAQVYDCLYSTFVVVMFPRLGSLGGMHDREVRAQTNVFNVCLHGESTIATIVEIALRCESCALEFVFMAVRTTAKSLHGHIRTVVA